LIVVDTFAPAETSTGLLMRLLEFFPVSNPVLGNWAVNLTTTTFRQRAQVGVSWARWRVRNDGSSLVPNSAREIHQGHRSIYTTAAPRKKRRYRLDMSGWLWYIENMNNPLPPDIEERLKARMSEGQYASEAELLRDAMDALDRLEEDRLLRWRDRNRLAIEQSQQGKSRPLNESAVLVRLRERLAAEGIVS
jgi:Arc/MetJ-type ribon-helix-helix transcriptional regulator